MAQEFAARTMAIQDQQSQALDEASRLRKQIQEVNKLDIPPEEKSRRIQVSRSPRPPTAAAT